MDTIDLVLKHLGLAYGRTKIDQSKFEFDSIKGPSIYSVLPYQVIQIIESKMINPGRDNNIKKIGFLDEILAPYGFKRMAAGTNRAVYRYYEDQSFCVKVSFTEASISDNPNEFVNQEYLKPFVNKIFSVSEHGVLSTCERVTPIRSREEFITVAEQVFDVIANRFVGRFLLEDIGTAFFKNWGLREGFGPVLLDYPYLYEVELNKLFCNEQEQPGVPCGGEIDYDDGFNYLFCRKCGKRHLAKQIGNDIKSKQILCKGDLDMIRGSLYINGQLVVTNEGQPNTTRAVDAREVADKRNRNNNYRPHPEYEGYVVIEGIKYGKPRDGGPLVRIGESKSKAVLNHQRPPKHPFGSDMIQNFTVPKQKPELVFQEMPAEGAANFPDQNANAPRVFEGDLSGLFGKKPEKKKDEAQVSAEATVKAYEEMAKKCAQEYSGPAIAIDSVALPPVANQVETTTSTREETAPDAKDESGVSMAGSSDTEATKESDSEQAPKKEQPDDNNAIKSATDAIVDIVLKALDGDITRMSDEMADKIMNAIIEAVHSTSNTQETAAESSETTAVEPNPSDCDATVAEPQVDTSEDNQQASESENQVINAEEKISTTEAVTTSETAVDNILAQTAGPEETLSNDEVVAMVNQAKREAWEESMEKLGFSKEDLERPSEEDEDLSEY